VVAALANLTMDNANDDSIVQANANAKPYTLHPKP